jgi:Tetratricopeptide repeat
MNRGVAYSMESKLVDALKDLNKAVESEPSRVDGYYNRALVFTKLGQLAEAAKDYTTAIQLNDRDVELYFSRAKVWEGLNQLDKAIADYGRVPATVWRVCPRRWRSGRAAHLTPRGVRFEAKSFGRLHSDQFPRLKRRPPSRFMGVAT